jgi:serine protease Do
MQIENESSGSGFIIARTQDELLIATNAHVVEDATSLSVCFTVDNAGEGAQMETAVAQAVIKGMDTANDLAVVSVAVDDIPEQAKDEITIAAMGSSSDLKVGEPAIAIGNALGYGQSVTLGIISALNREVTIDGVTSSLIQTDAAINFGNSGGVLLDVDGNVIGISSAKAASTGVEGMGYAIPIDTAKPILETLMNRETRTKLDEDQVGYLGVSLRDISTEARSLYNMPEGVFVYEVEGGSPADQAGIRRGDVITYFDGTSVASRERLGEQLSYYASGEQVEIVLQRVSGGAYQQQTVTVTLG